MKARFFADLPLVPGSSISLPAQAARHVQVLRLQPGDRITLFNGSWADASSNNADAPEGEYTATIERMGRSEVQVLVDSFVPTAREAVRSVHLVVGMPANERMDWLVEKASELGVASVQPVVAERSVLRLKGERAEKKQAHWQGVAIAACEQCGRNRVPQIHGVQDLDAWLRNGTTPGSPATRPGLRLLLSLQPDAPRLADAVAGTGLETLSFLSGPEGGLSAAEEAAALAHGFFPVGLGQRVLRAETAPLACLSYLAIA